MTRIGGSIPNNSEESGPEYSDEAATAFEFIRQWDGTQPEVIEADREAAAVMFEQLIEAKQIEFADQTTGNLMTYLRLDRFYNDDSAVTMSLVTSLMMAAAGGNRGTLRLIHEDIFGDTSQTYHYTLTNDRRTVRRTDYGDEQAKRQAGTPARVTGDIPGLSVGSKTQDAYENAALEDRMGLNNQPVGLEEMQHLAALVNEAIPLSPDNYPAE